MTPTDSIDFTGSAAYLRDVDTLVVADTHIGLEDALRRDGLSFPLGEREVLVEKLEDLLYQYDPACVVFDGDFLHDFSKLTRGTRDTVDAILGCLGSREVVVVAGSHDTMLGPAVEDDDVLVEENAHVRGRYLFTHGHILEFLVPGEVEVVVVGHDHPALDVDLQREECYLWGERLWRGRDLLVLPSFTPLTRGVAINEMRRGEFLSPVLREVDVGRLRPIIDVGEPLVFPPLSEMRRFLRA